MSHQLSTTALLLNGLRAGDVDASEQLFKLYHPILQRWARGRIPMQARSYMDTQDLVQETLTLALRSKRQIKANNAGAFFCYLRTIFINQIKQELRKNHLFQIALTTRFTHSEKMSYEDDVNSLIAYDQAIDQLSETEKQAVVMRVEFGLSHQEIADLMGKNSADAARVYIKRALLKLGEVIQCQNQN